MLAYPKNGVVDSIEVFVDKWDGKIGTKYEEMDSLWGSSPGKTSFVKTFFFVTPSFIFFYRISMKGAAIFSCHNNEYDTM